jgi:hypothetical protein
MVARKVSLFPRNKFSPAHPASAPWMSSLVAGVFEGVRRG